MTTAAQRAARELHVPFFVELLAALLAMVATIYNGAIRPWRARAKGFRILGASLVLPLLGLYAK